MNTLSLKLGLLTLSFGIALSACKKDDVEDPIIESEEECDIAVVDPPLPPSNVINYFPMTVGSYWIYDWTTTDTLGVESSFNANDTVRVIGDTLINGNIYVIFEGDYIGDTQYQNYYRDSANIIVDHTGRRVLSDQATIDTLWMDSFPGFSINYYLTDTSPASVNVPAGTYSLLLSNRRDIHAHDPNYPWGIPRSARSHYAIGIGNAEHFAFFVSSPELLRRRLTDYYIAP